MSPYLRAALAMAVLLLRTTAMTDKPTDLRAALRALPYSEGNVKRALVIDLLPPGDEPVYAVTASGLAAAIRRTAPQRMWPVRGVSEVSNETFAAAILAELKR